MRSIYFLSLTVVLFLFANWVSARGSVLNDVVFQQNKGQLKDQLDRPRADIQYYGSSGSIGFFLKKDGISYQLYQQKERNLITIHRIDISWAGAKTDAKIITDDGLDSYDNYYIGDNSLSRVKSFSSIVYQDIYNGIDLKYYSSGGSLKYEYAIGAGVDYQQIRLRVKGADIRINKDGSASFLTAGGEIREGAPLILQDGKKLISKWVVRDHELSFYIPNLDWSKPFIIDPLVYSWSIDYGTTGMAENDYANSCITDDSGNVYIAGQELASKGLLIKCNPSGTVQFTKTFGTPFSNGSVIYDISRDGQGNIIACGITNDVNNIATAGAFQATLSAGYDGFIIKYTNGGNKLWGTYYGGAGTDSLASCSAAANGSIYITGATSSNTGLSTSGAQQISYGGGSYDGLLAKFDANGQLVWSTYYGGPGYDQSMGITSINANGQFYIGGRTTSTSAVATSGAFQSVFGSGTMNGFIAKFDTTGQRIWGTYYGEASTSLESVTLDKWGYIYGVGTTTATAGIATVGSMQQANNGYQDAFIVKFNSAGSRIWATYAGGATNDEGIGCATDTFGRVYISGTTTSSSNIATAAAYQSLIYIQSAFLMEYDTSGQKTWGTYYGYPSGVNCSNCKYGGKACAADGSGNAYLCGWRSMGVNLANTNAILAKFNRCTSPIPIISSSANAACTPSSPATMSVAAATGATYQWYHSGNPIGGATSNSYTTLLGGSYYVTVDYGIGSCILNSNLFTLLSAQSPQVSVLSSNVSCNGGSNGSITLSVSGGAGPYSYAWNTLSATTPGITNLSAGSYTGIVTDANGCVKQQAITITQPAILATTTSQTDIACHGGNNGAIAMSISGGTNPYDALWNTGATTSSITGQPAGVYTVAITDAQGCTTADTVELTEPTAPVSTSIATINNTCYGDSSGLAVVTVSGGVPPYTYEWLNYAQAIMSITDSVSGLIAGTYTLEITDANTCGATEIFAIDQPAQAFVDICAVTVDSATGKNLVLWEKTGIQNAKLYKVYQETFISGQYNLIGAATANQLSTLLDTASNPMQQSYTYKVSVVDSCDNESVLSDYHKTIHLTANKGINGEVNLIWNAYEGRPYSTHQIMRSDNGGPFASIAQVSSSTTSYSDLIPPAGQKDYRIEIDLSSECNPTAKTTAYSSIASNIVTLEPLSVAPNGMNNDIFIYPNPTGSLLHIRGTNPANVRITDVTGRLLAEINATNDLSLSGYASGIYIITLTDHSGRNYYRKQIVKL